MRLRLIGVPTSAGAYGVGQENAPRVLRECGLVDSIEADIVDFGDLPITPFRPDAKNRRSQNIQTVVEVAGAVRDVVGEALADGDVPLVIGGDCTITLGVVAAVTAVMPDAVLAYFDGDVDMSTPETTESGVLDATGIAHLLNIDGADPRLAGLGAGAPLIGGERLALIGFEVDDLSEEHESILDEKGVRRFPASELREDLTATLARIDRFLGPNPRIVHFDVDAIDSIDLPLAEYPHFNAGVSVETASRVLTHLCSTPQLAALIVTEANPRRDPDGIYMQRLSQLISMTLNQAEADSAG
ncbi:MAG: arginase family protein [Acidimicrobiia bacterium]